ncbi:MAG: hypothetical protein R3C14_55055 [Caldilineaceae bacterium]
MERVAFLIEATNVRIPCMLNPASFELQRSVGVNRTSGGQLVDTDLTDDPVLYSGRGSTSFTLDLLFDVTLTGAPTPREDVRELTAPFWQLAEYRSERHRYDELPQVRFIWGKAWNIPCVIAAVAERYERFTANGVPQRSWLRMSLLRVGEAVLAPPATPFGLDDLPESITPPSAAVAADAGWESHEVLGGGADSERLDQLASHYYGDPSLWRLIARANNLDDPAQVPPGALLQIPPLTVIQEAIMQAATGEDGASTP